MDSSPLTDDRSITGPSRIAYKPHSFVAFFEPAGRDADTPRPTSSLAFQTIVETERNRVTLCYGERDMLTTSPDGQRVLLVAGDIYRPQAADVGQAMLDLYDRQGIDFLRDLNGLFALILVDRGSGQILIATDRMNSNKVLTSRHGDTLIASNSLYLHPLYGAPLDRTAIACYLAGSFAYNRRTFFEGVEMLASGSAYRLENGRLEQHKYWHYVFQPPATASSQEALRQEFEALFVEAVRIRYRADRPTYLSLTGGSDSCVIMGILAKRLQVPDVHCFTYAQGEPQPGSDEYVAARLAPLCGYEHRVEQGFDGDAITTLRRNDRLGGGMARLCDEVDAWERLGAETANGPTPVLFSGDTLLVFPEWTLMTMDDIQASTRMPNFSVLSWLQPFIGERAYREYVASTQAEFELAVKDVPRTGNLTDFRDMVRFEQIHSRITSAWREYFTGHYFKSAMPLLDNDILDFVLKLPSEQRVGKRIHQETVTRMFPELFVLPRAESASYATYWPAAIRRQTDDLRAYIQERSSPLDDMIDPQILLTLLAADRKSFTRWNTRVGKALMKGYRVMKRYGWHRTALGRPSLYTSAVSAERFFLRAVSLRGVLAEIEASQ